jgi:hypothetical protein
VEAISDFESTFNEADLREKRKIVDGYYSVLFCFGGGWTGGALGFELRASCFLGGNSYFLSHSAILNIFVGVQTPVHHTHTKKKKKKSKNIC